MASLSRESLQDPAAAACHIPPRFWTSVCLHLAQNYGGVDGAPLILGVHGPPGSGKSFQLEQALARLDVKMVLISGGQLEDASAGAPAKLIRRSYLEVSDSTRDGMPAALVFNDLDTGLGEWAGNTGTVNHQTVLGELMHLVDSPENVAGHPTRRCPVFATGNDFTKLYEPLRRPGRMELFAWLPDDGERREIVGRIFNGYEPDLVEQLVDEFRGQPISFFTHLRASAQRDVLSAAIAGSEREQIHELAKGSRLQNLAQPDSETVLEVGRRISAATAISSHL